MITTDMKIIKLECMSNHSCLILLMQASYKTLTIFASDSNIRMDVWKVNGVFFFKRKHNLKKKKLACFETCEINADIFDEEKKSGFYVKGHVSTFRVFRDSFQ